MFSQGTTDVSEGAGWYRRILGALRAMLGAALLVASMEYGIAQDIAVHHTIKTEYQRKGISGKNSDDQSFTISPDGKTLAFRHGNYDLVLWDLVKNKPRMAAGARKLIVWDPDTDKERVVEHYEKKNDERALKWIVEGMAFSVDGKTLVSKTWDGYRFLDVAACRDKGIAVARLIESRHMALSSDGQTLVINPGLGILLWDVKRDRLRVSIPIGPGWDPCVSIASETQMLTVVPPDGESIELWNVETGKRQEMLIRDGSSYKKAVISPNGKTVTGTVASLQHIHLWDVAAKNPTSLLINPKKDSGGIKRMRFSPDSRTFAVLEGHGRLSLWEVLTGKQRATLPGTRHVPEMEFSPDGRFLAVGTERAIRFWDLAGVKRKPPDAEETARLWKDLRSEDAEAAYQAVRTLTAFPTQALPMLRKELQPRFLSAEDSRKIDASVAHLDSDDFAAREKASKELEQMGSRAEATLHRALAGRPALESRRRLQELLEGIERKRKGAKPIQELRALEVLEHIGTAEAHTLLEEVVKGIPDARLMQDAQASLARLKKRPIAKR